MFDFLRKRSEISNEKKLEQIYQAYKKYMFSIALSILHDRDDAQDAIQNAIMKIYHSISSFDGVETNKTRSLIRVVVKNAALDLYRHKGKSQSSSIGHTDLHLLVSEDPTPEDLVIRISDAEWLASKIAEMNPDYADIIMLKYFNDLSDIEISSILCISHEATRVRLHRARKALKKILDSNREAI